MENALWLKNQMQMDVTPVQQRENQALVGRRFVRRQSLQGPTHHDVAIGISQLGVLRAVGG
jgi:hypothetical protein